MKEALREAVPLETEQLIVPCQPDDTWSIRQARIAGTNTDSRKAKIWHGLFIVALKRLQRARPQWADDLYCELTEFLCSLLQNESDLSAKEFAAWLRTALEHMERRPYSRGRSRTGKIRGQQDIGGSPEFLLLQYRYILPRLQLLQREWKEEAKSLRQQQKARQKGAGSRRGRNLPSIVPIHMNQRTRRLFNILSAVGIVLEPTDLDLEELVGRLGGQYHGWEPPSEIAKEILCETHGKLSMVRIKRALASARRSNNPLRVYLEGQARLMNRDELINRELDTAR